VLIPIVALFLRAFQMSWREFFEVVTADRAIAAYRLTFGASLIAAVANAGFGTILAWVLVRYDFPGKRFIDALVDFPFALRRLWPVSLCRIFLRQWLARPVPGAARIKGAIYSVRRRYALTSSECVRRPHFAARPGNLDRGVEEVAATLGAGRFRTFINIIAPTLLPSILTGFALSFARAVGSMAPLFSSPATSLSIRRLLPTDRLPARRLRLPRRDGYCRRPLIVSFIILALINYLEVWSRHFQHQ